MLKRLSSYTFASLLAFALTTSQASGQQPGDMEIRQGVIEQITAVQLQTNHHRGVGAIIGGLGGLGIGSLIGAGTGRDVAMVAGALGGALMGNNVLVAVTQPVDTSLKTGQRVYIEGSGEGARVISQ